MSAYGSIRLLWVCVEAQRLKGSWTWYEAFIPHVSCIKPKSNSEKQQVWPPVLKRHQRSTATSSEKQRPHRSLTAYLLPGQYKCNHTCSQKFRWRWRPMQHRIAQKYQYSTQLCLQLEAAAIWHPTSYCNVHSAGGADSASPKKRKAQGCTPN